MKELVNDPILESKLNSVRLDELTETTASSMNFDSDEE